MQHTLYINGRYQDATSGETFVTRNPATGKLLADVQQASLADVDKAVEAAQAGFLVWSAMSGAERGRILMRAVAILRERNDELAGLEPSANGWDSKMMAYPQLVTYDDTVLLFYNGNSFGKDGFGIAKAIVKS